METETLDYLCVEGGVYYPWRSEYVMLRAEAVDAVFEPWISSVVILKPLGVR